MSNRPIIVLGAGPAGLSTAWQLAKGGQRVVVLEQNRHVGGLGGTVTLNGFRLDYGPHIFCLRETEDNRAIVRELMPFFGQDPRVFERRDRIHLLGKYYTYPVRIHELLSGVPLGLAFRILWDYVRANTTLRFQPPTKDASFEEWGVKNLGRTLYELCFGIYSRKVWGLPTSQISSRQAQRVAKLNLTEIILRIFGFKVDPVTHFRKFMYPRGGIGLVYERMAEDLASRGGSVKLGCPMKRLIRSKQRVECVVYESPDCREETIECEGVVSSLPLPLVVECFNPQLDPWIRARAARLRYRSLQFCYVVVKRERVTDLHWCYLLDEPYRCNRVSEQKNVSEEMLPPDKTVLSFEISCDKGDQIWNASDEELRRIVEGDIRRSRILNDVSEIEGFFTRRVEYAYPVYQLQFEENLFPVLEVLHRLDNFISVGRHGLFLNNSMDDNIILGVRLGKFLCDGGDGPVTWRCREWFQQMDSYMHLRFEGK